MTSTILGSIGGALSVAERVGGPAGRLLAHAAQVSFISGMDLGLLTGAAVGLAGCLIALVAMPSRPGGSADQDLLAHSGR